MITLRLETYGADPRPIVEQLRQVFDVAHELYDDSAAGLVSLRVRLREQNK